LILASPISSCTAKSYTIDGLLPTEVSRIPNLILLDAWLSSKVLLGVMIVKLSKLYVSLLSFEVV